MLLQLGGDETRGWTEVFFSENLAIICCLGPQRASNMWNIFKNSVNYSL